MTKIERIENEIRALTDIERAEITEVVFLNLTLRFGTNRSNGIAFPDDSPISRKSR